GFPSLESIRSFVLVFSKGHPQVRRSRPGLVQNGAGFADVSAPKANDQWRIVQSWGAIEEEGTLEYERCSTWVSAHVVSDSMKRRKQPRQHKSGSGEATYPCAPLCSLW